MSTNLGASQTVPPSPSDEVKFEDILHLDVEYPHEGREANIPDEWLVFVVAELRKNLEHSLYLETELGGYGLNISTRIVADDWHDANEDGYERGHGLSGSVIVFYQLFDRLIKLDIEIARRELDAWPIPDDTIFSRLRICAAGECELTPAREFGLAIAGLSDEAFWDSYH